MRTKSKSGLGPEADKLIELLQQEGQLTRRCLLKRLGCNPNLDLLEAKGVIRRVDGATSKYELAPASTSAQ